MARRSYLTREFFIPQGAVKVQDKETAAVAYLYQRADGVPCAVAFYGKAQKPVWQYRFKDAAARESRLRSFFKHYREIEAYKSRRAAERKEAAAKAREAYKVGDVLNTCWGYEQTNVEYFEVTEVKGATITLRQLKKEYVASGPDRGKSVPLPGAYCGEPIKRRIGPGSIKIDECRRASPTDFQTVAGVKIYRPRYESSYA